MKISKACPIVLHVFLGDVLRLLEDQSTANSVHSQALESLQEKLHGTEMVLEKEREMHQQVQVNTIVTYLCFFYLLSVCYCKKSIRTPVIFEIFRV